jgi:hypothetical protein
MTKQWTTKGDFRAYCFTCGWSSQAANALGTGALHARKHGHRVSVEIERTVCYDYEAAPPASEGESK